MKRSEGIHRDIDVNDWTWQWWQRGSIVSPSSSIWGTIVGALIIGIINNGLDLMNVNPFMQQVVKGAIIVIAIIIDERKNR